jgi:hypothetical protein
MKEMFSLKALIVVCLTSLGICLQSCDNDDESNGQVTLLSFGPSGVKHGETIKFVGTNLDKATAIVLPPSIEITRDGFASQSKELIELVVPDAAESGKVILRSPQGDIETKTLLSFDVDVVINSITAEAKPGTNITITGDKVNWIESIVFPKDLLVEKESFVSQSLTELVVTVPMEAQSGILTFFTGGTDPLDFTSEEPLDVKLPQAEALTPSIRHAADLTLSGTDLDLVTQIDFPGGASVMAEDFKSHSETAIVVVVPPTALNGKLVLTAPSGLKVETSNSISIILPIVSAFSPEDTEEHDAGVTLTLVGTDLDLVEKITFPNVAEPVTDFTRISDTEIQVVIPDGVQGGTVMLTTIHAFAVPVSLPFGDQLQLAIVFFDDAIKGGFSQWGGWGSTTDWNNSEQIRLGSKAIKMTYTGGNWSGAAQFGAGNALTDGAAFFAFSLYGGAGTGGKKIQLLVKRTGGESTKQFTIEEGKWTDIKVPLADLGSPANITEIFFQNADFTGTVFIDHVGLK